MKPFSFTNISRTQHVAVTRWLRVSSAMTGLCIAILLCISATEYFLNKNITMHHQQLQQAIHARTTPALDPNMQLMITKVESRQKKSKHPLALLKHIQSICKEDSCLESLHLKHHEMHLTIAAKNTTTLMAMAGTFADQSPYKNVHISSLEPKEQRMIATLKCVGEIKNT